MYFVILETKTLVILVADMYIWLTILNILFFLLSNLI